VTATAAFGSAFAAALVCLGLAVLILLLKLRSPLHRFIAFALLALTLSELGNGLGLLERGHALFWRRLASMGEIWLPIGLLLVGSTLIASSALSGMRQDGARRRGRILAAIAALLTGLAWSDAVFALARLDTGEVRVALGPLGRLTYVFVVLSLALGIAQLESILRSTREPLRYQLKFVLIGLGAIAGYQVYQGSQLLLFPVWRDDYVLAGAVAALISVGLVAFGLARTRLQQVTAQVTVSPQMLYGSVTVLAVGLYLLTVGLIAQIVRMAGWSASVGLSTLLVFVAVIGLVVMASSRTARGELRRFVSRHFYRSKYDYRSKWLEVTDAFGDCGSVDSTLDRLIDLLGRTFGAGRISVWLRFEADGRFHQVRSANIEPAPPALADDHPVARELRDREEPVTLDELYRDSEGRSALLDFLQATRAALVAPIRSEGELVGFVALSRELHGRYGTDDGDLLRAITHHLGVLLGHARLAEERRAAAELEALHRLSAFCLHDLKNLANRLGVVVQNAAAHRPDPAFQASAMQIVTSTVEKMNALMTKLSRLPRKSGASEWVDVRELVAETVGSFDVGCPVKVKVGGEAVPLVKVPRGELQQVLLNLLLNAQQAQQAQSAGNGEIRVETREVEGSVVVTVTDQGPGIPSHQLRTLFEPFRTTKDGGLGIGLYECRRIIEAQRGKIRFDSEPGRGTEVRIELPIEPVEAVKAH